MADLQVSFWLNVHMHAMPQVLTHSCHEPPMQGTMHQCSTRKCAACRSYVCSSHPPALLRQAAVGSCTQLLLTKSEAGCKVPVLAATALTELIFASLL
jgi:hypothetical protein